MIAPGGQIVNATGDVFDNAYIIGQSGTALTKHDRLGNHLWTHRLTTDKLNAAACLAAAGGDCYVGGRTMGTATVEGDDPQTVFGSHAFVARYAGDGTLLWARLIGSTGSDIGNRMVVDADDNCHVVGNTSGCIDGRDTPSSGTDPFVAKLSKTGELVWISQVREGSASSGLGVGVDENGQVTIAGEPGYVATFDAEGQRLSYHQFSHGIPSMLDVAVDGLGNAYFCGWDGPYNAIVKRFGNDGVQVWDRRFRLNGWSCPKSIAVCPDGSNDIVTGGCEGAPSGGTNCQAFSRRFDTEGNQVSMYTSMVGICGQRVGVDVLGNWYVIGDTVVIKAGAPVYTTAPLQFEAESAAIQGGTVETAQADYCGSGYVSFDGNAPAEIEWNAGVARAGVKTLVWRFQNGAGQTIPAPLQVNGLAAASGLDFVGTTDGDGWTSISTEAYLNTGNNTITVAVPENAQQGLCLDRLEIVDVEDNIAQGRMVTCSSQTDTYPAAAALDGRLPTCWQVSEYPQWIEIDLGQPYPISQVRLTGRSTGACRFEVETRLTTDDTYQQVVDCRDATDALATTSPVANAFPRTLARYVRLSILGDDDSEDVDIQEFGVFVSPEQMAICIGTRDYRTIQAAIDDAEDGATVTLQPGVYAGNGNGDLHWGARPVTLTSTDASDPDVVVSTVIKGSAAMPVLRLTDLGPESRVVGLTVTGGLTGLQCENASPQIEHCRIVENLGAGIEMQVKSDPTIHHTLICANQGQGILMVPKTAGRMPVYNEPHIVNCTIAHNASEGATGGKFVMRNCIVWANGAKAGAPQLAPVQATVTYSCIEGGFAGEGNLDADPMFLGAGDYHLALGSPCIDTGDPGENPGEEPIPNGDRINLGAYGGTVQATCSAL